MPYATPGNDPLTGGMGNPFGPNWAVFKLARTCLFDAASARLFVVLPRTDEKTPPELRVYRATD
jgi:hypothetical protein